MCFLCCRVGGLLSSRCVGAGGLYLELSSFVILMSVVAVLVSLCGSGCWFLPGKSKGKISVLFVVKFTI